MQIQRSFKDTSSYGKLYLVATPIGNLQDTSTRMLETLEKVDYIAAEDTRNTGRLLDYFDISTKLISFHDHNSRARIPEIIALLKEGHDLAQVSDAGLPCISDPGHDLVKATIAENIIVVSVPGPSAGISALIASGLAPQPHIFYGFLPRKKGQQIDFFKGKVSYPETQIFYESPYRVADTLENMHEVYGNRQVTLVRELTKLYEEYQRGSISEILDYIASNPLKGECLLIVAGASENSREENLTSDVTPVKAVEALIASGMKPNQAIKTIAKERKINRQELYNLFHRV